MVTTSSQQNSCASLAGKLWTADLNKIQLEARCRSIRIFIYYCRKAKQY